MKTIYLELDDDIAEVIDKLKGVPESDVSLVLPVNSSFSGSVVNFKLLSHKAAELGKTVTLVSNEAKVRSLATEAGLKLSLGAAEVAKPEVAEVARGPISFKVPKPGDQVLKTPSTVTAPVKTPEKEDFFELNIPFIKFNKKTLMLAGGTLALLGVIAFFVFVPRATVKIFPPITAKTASADVIIEDGLKELNVEAGLVPGVLTEVKVEKSGEYTATGKAQASGKVNMKRTTVGSAVTFPSGTRLINEAPSPDREYVATSSFTIRSCDASEHPSCPGQDVDVQAPEGGAEYNVADGQGTFKVKNETLYSGTSKGISGGDKKTVSATDADNAKKDLEPKAVPEAEAELDKRLPDGKVVESTIKKEVTLRTVPETNQVTDTGKFEAFLSVKISAMVFDEKHVIEVLTARLGLPDEETIYELSQDKFLYTLAPGGEIKDGKVKINVSGPVLIGPKIDTEKLRSDLVGKSATNARKLLESNDKIKKFEIENRPSFFRSMPRIKANIKIEIVVEASDEE